MDRSRPLNSPKTLAECQLKMLNPEQVQRIDELLASVGEYGEVHLIVQRGELRYVNRVESYRAWNHAPRKRAS